MFLKVGRWVLLLIIVILILCIFVNWCILFRFSVWLKMVWCVLLVRIYVLEVVGRFGCVFYSVLVIGSFGRECGVFMVLM